MAIPGPRPASPPPGCEISDSRSARPTIGAIAVTSATSSASKPREVSARLTCSRPQLRPPALNVARSSAPASMSVRSSRQRALRSGRPPVAAWRSATGCGARASASNLLKSGTSNSYSQNGPQTVAGMSCTTPAPRPSSVSGSIAAMKSASTGIAARSSSATPSMSCWAGSCSAASASIRRVARARVFAMARRYGRRVARAMRLAPPRLTGCPPSPSTAGVRAARSPRGRGIDGPARRQDHPGMLIGTHSPLAEVLAGTVRVPGDPGWDDARSAFNLLLDHEPAAVAFPADAADVAAAVRYARATGLRVAPQATGHNQGPLGDLEGTLLLNVRALQQVRVDPAARRVRVGAGVKWERVAPRLSAHGLAGLHGSSPDVGIAGYSLGGGIGWLSRKHGLQCNAVTALELVTAEGELIRTDADHHPDLFWALRGGGGNFGVVTAIEFAVHPVDQLYAGAMFFPFERSAEVLHTWNGLLPGLPEEMMSWASVIHFPPIPDVPAFARGRSFAVVMAAHLGEEAEGRAL